jgi:hypothetical protein
MRRDSWNFLADKELNYLATQENMSLPDFKASIKEWNKKVILNDFVAMKPNLPSHLYKYFDLISSSILKETIYMNSWQAASRVKDPTGHTRSINVCLGWTLNEVNEMLKWGSNDSISYSPITEKRLLRTQRNAIPRPYVLSSASLSFIPKWMTKQPIPLSNIGFNENLLEGIRSYVLENGYASTQDIWLSLCDNNIEFSNLTDKHDNGYLISALNALLLYEIGDDIAVTKSSPIDFHFSPSLTPAPHKKSFYLNKEEYLDILEVLRAIHLLEKDRILYSDIRNFISPAKLSTPRLHELLNIIIDNNLFEGSTYKIEMGAIIKTTTHLKDYDRLTSYNSTAFKKYPYTQELTKALIEWYYNDLETIEIDLTYLSLSSNLFFQNVPLTNNLLITLLNSPEYATLTSLNLELEIVHIPDNILITRKNINY